MLIPTLPKNDSTLLPRDPRDPRAAFVCDLLAIRPDLRARALRLTRDEAHADDLVQDAIERALRCREQFVPGTNLRSWAQTIVFSVFVSGYRRRRRERALHRRQRPPPLQLRLLRRPPHRLRGDGGGAAARRE